jgi:hypothetical protein
MYTLCYDSGGQIFSLDESGNETVVENLFSSKPSFSPDGSKAVYISPLLDGERSNLLLFSLRTAKKEIIELPRLTKEEKVRFAIWINNHMLALIIGEIHGKLAVGGNVYTYDIALSELLPLTRYDISKKQAINMRNANGSLQINTIEFSNRDLTRFDRREEVVNL